MSRKKVLFFIESFSGGGAERVLLTVLRNIDMAKFEVTILVVSDSGVYRRDFHELGVKIVPVLDNSLNTLNNIKYKLVYNLLPPKLTVKWLLKDIEADTYVAFIEGFCTKVFAKLPKNKRKITWVHIDLDAFPWTIEKGIYRDKNEEINTYHNYDNVIGVSQQVTEMLANKYGLHSAQTIYNPIDEDRIRRLSVNDNIDIDKEYFNMVSVGRLTKQKGYDKLIGLMPEMLSSNPQLRLYIIGEGEERQNLEDNIERLNLQKQVKLLGFMDNPYSLMKEMDLFVCSSIAEGFSLVIAEAMIVGLPVVSMECAGPSELLGNGEYGMLCRTFKELDQTILRVSTDSDLLQSLKNKAQTRSRHFNTTSIIRQIESIL